MPRVFDFLHNPHPPVVMCRMKAPSPAHSWDGEPWRVLATEFSGREEEDIQIPLWVADIVQHGTLPAQTEQTKYSFTLRPAEVGCSLPGQSGHAHGGHAACPDREGSEWLYPAAS